MAGNYDIDPYVMSMLLQQASPEVASLIAGPLPSQSPGQQSVSGGPQPPDPRREAEGSFGLAIPPGFTQWSDPYKMNVKDIPVSAPSAGTLGGAPYARNKNVQLINSIGALISNTMEAKRKFPNSPISKAMDRILANLGKVWGKLEPGGVGEPMTAGDQFPGTDVVY